MRLPGGRTAIAGVSLFEISIGSAAEEAIVNLTAFAPVTGIAGLDIIHRYDRSEEADPLIDEQLEEVTEDWLELRHMREMGFTAGHFSLEQLSQGPVLSAHVWSRV